MEEREQREEGGYLVDGGSDDEADDEEDVLGHEHQTLHASPPHSRVSARRTKDTQPQRNQVGQPRRNRVRDNGEPPRHQRHAHTRLEHSVWVSRLLAF